MESKRLRGWYTLAALLAAGALLLWRGTSTTTDAQGEPPLQEAGFSRTTAGPDLRPGEVLVRFAPEATLSDVGQALHGVGGAVVKVSPGPQLIRLSVPPGREESAAAILRANPLVLEAGPNLLVRIYEVPNDLDAGVSAILTWVVLKGSQNFSWFPCPEDFEIVAQAL